MHSGSLAIFLAALLELSSLPVSRAASSRFAVLDGHKIHYLSFGQGDRAVVFIHGWTCDSTFWKMQAPVYEKRRSLLIDLRATASATNRRSHTRWSYLRAP